MAWCPGGEREGKIDGKKGVGSIDKIDATRVIDDDWEEINVTVDSGAVDHVAGDKVAAQFGTRDTEMSRRGGY